MSDETQARILVVEDDADLAMLLERYLGTEGYDAHIASDGPTALRLAAGLTPDAVVLDLGLPGMDGMEVLRRLRERDDVPVLILTARVDVPARVDGLDAGADDYLAKPFVRQELLARLRALLRRRPATAEPLLRYADVAVNEETRVARRGDRDLDLTQREYELLVYFLQRPQIVIPREQLLQEVWEYDLSAVTNTIEVFISHLRRKLEAGGQSRLVHTIRGVGYVLRADDVS